MLFITLFACSITSIEDGWRHGNVTQVKDSFTSTFLITPSDGSIILIDAGYNKKGKPIINKLEEMGKDASDVSKIFLTHGHSDHVAGASVFINAEIYAIAEEQSDLAESDISIDVTIQHGDVIKMDDSSLEVFWLPGHSPGNAVYLVDGVLIFGDSAQSLKDGTISTPSEKFSDDPQQAEAELAKLAQIFEAREADVDWLAFSHTGVMKGVQPLLDYVDPE
jgi:glyoxylase-like metal-dependent hydrolase (beta-lactamase superfamily II)